MAKEATATITESKPFDHNGRFAVVLVPQNSKHETYVRRTFDEKYGPEAPPLANVIKVTEISQDTILYVAHPVRVKRKVKDSKGREVWKKALEMYVSRPIDVAAECTDSPRRGAKIVDFNKIVQAVNQVVQNDMAGWSFGAFLSGFNKADFSEATLQLINH